MRLAQGLKKDVCSEEIIMSLVQKVSAFIWYLINWLDFFTSVQHPAALIGLGTQWELSSDFLILVLGCQSCTSFFSLCVRSSHCGEEVPSSVIHFPTLISVSAGNFATATRGQKPYIN